MNKDVRRLLADQKNWQKRRAGKSWAEKIREAESVRSLIKSLKGSSIKESRPRYSRDKDPE